MSQYAIIEKEITEGAPAVGWGDVKAFANISHFYIYSQADVLLTSNWEIESIDTPAEGHLVYVYFNGDIGLNGFNINIFGHQLTQAQARKKNIFTCRWEGAAWEVYAMESYDVYNPGQSGVETLIISPVGDAVTLDRNVNESYIVLTHNTEGQNQTGAYNIGPGSGPFVDGDEFWISYEADVTYSGGSVAIFGETLSGAEASTPNTLFFCKYDADIDDWHIYKFAGWGSSVLTDKTTIDFNGSYELYDMLWEAGTGTNAIKQRTSASTASGQRSLAVGYHTKASGAQSFAGGFASVADAILASGPASFAFGYVNGAGIIQATSSGSLAGGYSASGYDINCKSGGSLVWMLATTNDAGIMDGFSGGSFVTGTANTIITSLYASIIGGNANSIAGSQSSGILGGRSNSVTNALYGTIIGGYDNTVAHAYSAIIGGTLITTRETYTTYVEYLDFKDTSSIRVSGTRNVPAKNVPVAPRAGKLLDEVGIYAIKLDDWSTPDDNTDLNVTETYHGLCPKLSGNAAEYLNGEGTWSAPSGASSGETNLTDNVGGGAGVFRDKTGVTFHLRSLVDGGLVTITENADDILIETPDFGTSPGDVVEIGTELGVSEVVVTDAAGKLETEARGTAFNKDFTVAGGDNGTSDDVARADHTHTGIDPNAHAVTHIAGGSDEIDGGDLFIDTAVTVLTPSGTTLAEYITAIEAFAAKHRSGSFAITAGPPSQVTYSTPFGHTNYALTVRTYVQATGVPVAANVTKVGDGFVINPAQDCQVDYIAISYI